MPVRSRHREACAGFSQAARSSSDSTCGRRSGRAKQPLSVRGEARFVAMGSASDGPVLLISARRRFSAQILLLDLRHPETVRNTRMQDVDPRCTAIERSGPRIRLRRRTCLQHRRCQSNVRLDVYRRELDSQRRATSSGIRRFLTRLAIAFIRHVRRLRTTGSGGQSGRIPTVSAAVKAALFPRFTARSDLRLNPRNPGISASVGLPDEDKPLLTLRDLPFPAMSRGGPDRPEKNSFDKRVYLIPSAKTIALLPEGQEQVVLCRFDLDKELERSGGDYLVVVSAHRALFFPARRSNINWTCGRKRARWNAVSTPARKGCRFPKTGWSAGP